MKINAALYKTTCFGVSALYAVVEGGLSAFAVGFVSPESFGLVRAGGPGRPKGARTLGGLA